MKSLMFALSLVTQALCQNLVQDCENFTDDNFIKEAFRMENYLFLITSNYQFFRLDNFKWNGNKFIYSNAFNLSKWLPDHANLVVTFSVDYPGKGQRVVFITQGQVDEINQLKGKLIPMDSKGNLMTAEDININKYKFKPNTEPLNLQSILAKLPEQNIEDSLVAVSNFPLKGAPDLPTRLFVYYIEESKTSSLPKKCINCYRSKRFVFVLESRVYSRRGKGEPDWHTDGNSSSQCEDLDGVKVNASVAITDYMTSDSGWFFDLMEFFGSQYRVYRVTITNNNTLLPLRQLVRSNPINSLLSSICKLEEPPKTNNFQHLLIVIAIVVIVILLVVAIVQYYFCVVRKRGFLDIQRPRKESEEKVQLISAKPRLIERMSGSDDSIRTIETDNTDKESNPNLSLQKPVDEPQFEASRVVGPASDQPNVGPPIEPRTQPTPVNEPTIEESRVENRGPTNSKTYSVDIKSE